MIHAGAAGSRRLHGVGHRRGPERRGRRLSGYGDFNARRNAKNFTHEEAAAAVSYCHLRGAKVFLTLNTLLTDRELPGAARVAEEINEMGVDAVIVQDLGVAGCCARWPPTCISTAPPR